jgi:hypothetical protein
MNIRFLFWSILGVLLLNACKKDVVDYSKREIGFSYVNQSLNYTFLYQVQEIIYDDFFNKIDTFNYQILERNDTLFYDNLNQTVLRIERYKRKKDSSLWYYHETVSSRIDQYKYERNENNTKKVKLSFPITFETIWNANTFNSNNNTLVYYSEINAKKKINNQSYDSVLVIKSDAVFNSVGEKYYEELYAKQIGLIYSNIIFVEKSNNKTRGYKIKYTLLNHGF